MPFYEDLTSSSVTFIVILVFDEYNVVVRTVISDVHPNAMGDLGCSK